MEATALFIRLLMPGMILLCAHHKNVDAAFLHVFLNRLQFFEYDSITFYCEGVFDCEVVHKSKGKIPCGPTSTGSSCIIRNVYPEDSGEYWFDAGGGRKSNSLNITVTAGSVILESPALAVMEGQAVTLRCRNKTTSSQRPSHFYKNGHFIRNSSKGNMTFNSVSKSDEGLYKCNISGAGESPESWLTVREVHKETCTTSSNPTPWIFVTVLLAILLLMVGLFHLAKCYWFRGSAQEQTVSVGSSEAEPSSATYTVVKKKTRKKKAEDQLSSRPIYYTLSAGNTQQLVDPGVPSITVIPAPSANTSRFLTEDLFYSTIQ